MLSLTLFIAILTTLAQLSRFRDGGVVRFRRALTAWIRPVLKFALPLVAVIAAATLVIAPWAQLKSVEYRERSNNRDDASRVAPGVFRESARGERVFFVEIGAGEDGRVRNVFVSSMQQGRLGVMVSAEGFLRTDEQGERFVVLQNGRRYEGTPGTPDYRVMEFERYSMRLQNRASVEPPQKPRMMSLRELIDDPAAANRGELLSRIGTPVAALLLSLLAIPMSFVNPRAGRTNNLIAAILTYLVYTNTISIAQAWVTQGKIGFSLALWIPHLVVLLLLGALFYKRLSLLSIWRRRTT